MTPAQQAKEYAAAYGYTLTSNYSIRRIIVTHGDRELGRYAKYDGCLNAMRAEQSGNPVRVQVDATDADPFKLQGSAPTELPRGFYNLNWTERGPTWRLWWKCPNREHSGWHDFHNYADCVKQLRRVFSSADVAIIKGTKYAITRVPC